MSDNDLRTARVLELGAQTKLYLDDAANDYDHFKTKCAALNPKLEDLYRTAGLTPPANKQVEILQYTAVGQSAPTSEVAQVLEVIGDIGTFIGITKSLGPPAATWLSKTGKLPAATAEKLIVDRSIILYEDAVGAARGVAGPPAKIDIEITGADIAGHILAGVVAGLAVGAVDLAIFFAEQLTLQKHLEDAITSLHPLRTATLLAKRRTRTALDSLSDTIALLDALSGQGQAVAAKVLAAGQNAIVATVSKELDKAATADSVAAELRQKDQDNGSYTKDDPAYVV